MESDDRTRRLLERVDGHYGRDAGVAERLLAHLHDRGIDPARTPFDEIPPHDELHLRGRAATIELAELGTLAGPLRVLDLGCGIGGSSRFLAARFGCAVVGIDLTAEFCRSARVLSKAFGLDAHTRFVRADATRLPFRDSVFPVVWTQHAQMNVEDKHAFYGEACRVLEPGGQLLFHDLFAAGDDQLDFPVLWAPEPDLSHLAPAETVAEILLGQGLRRVEWRERTLPSIAWLRELIADADPAELEREQRGDKLRNVLRGLEHGRLRVIQARWDRPAGGR